LPSDDNYVYKALGLLSLPADGPRPMIAILDAKPGIECLGRVTAQTTLFSDAPSADIFIRVLDVLEFGETVNVGQGILRFTDPQLAEGGVPVQVDLGPIAHRFASDHRIRLLIASAAHPYFNRNLGTGESPVTATTIVVAHQGVSVGGTGGLRVNLPLARSTS
jgi:predicted acyl esterase